MVDAKRRFVEGILRRLQAYQGRLDGSVYERRNLCAVGGRRLIVYIRKLSRELILDAHAAELCGVLERPANRHLAPLSPIQAVVRQVPNQAPGRSHAIG